MKKPLSLTEHLIQNIRQDILNGEYPPDSPLRQDALATKYDVSRIPVREALLQLEAEGLVTIIPRKGAIVTPLSMTEIDDIFSLRSLLEVRLYKESAPKLSATDLENAINLNHQYQQAIEQKEHNLLGVLNAKLHMALYVKANMPKTQQILFSLLQTSERYTRIQLHTETALAQSIKEHAELLTLTEKGKFEEGAKLLTSHITTVWNDLIKILRDSISLTSK